MDSTNYHFLSEAGFDNGSKVGRFGRLPAAADGDFHQSWWDETCRFEEYINRTFRPEEVFVSDHEAFAKEFVIWPMEKPPFDALCEACVSYLRSNHPDGAVVMASPLDSPMPVGSMTLTPDSVWVEQDVAWWIAQRTRQLQVKLPGFDGAVSRWLEVNLARRLPWLNRRIGKRLPPVGFWEAIYSGDGFAVVGQDGHDLGHYIRRRVVDTPRIRELIHSGDVFVAGQLGKHRITKVECSLACCLPELVESVFALVQGIDGAWAIRFSVFENLTTDDSYCGSLLVSTAGDYLIEAAE